MADRFIVLTDWDGSRTVVNVEMIQKITTYKGRGSITFKNSDGGGGVSCSELPDEIAALIKLA